MPALHGKPRQRAGGGHSQWLRAVTEGPARPPQGEAVDLADMMMTMMMKEIF